MVFYKTASENASVAQLVEHHVANVIVACSNLVTRSIFFVLILGRSRVIYFLEDNPANKFAVVF